MKTGFFVFALGLLSGCSFSAHQALPRVGASDYVAVKNEYGSALPLTEIKEAAAVSRLVDFVNALPQKWSVPWSGPPVGKVYFSFHRDGKVIGNFCIGPNFFGRDGGNFWSQTASKKQMDQLSEIVGFDVWAYVHEEKPRP